MKIEMMDMKWKMLSTKSFKKFCDIRVELMWDKHDYVSHLHWFSDDKRAKSGVRGWEGMKEKSLNYYSLRWWCNSQIYKWRATPRFVSVNYSWRSRREPKQKSFSFSWQIKISLNMIIDHTSHEFYIICISWFPDELFCDSSWDRMIEHSDQQILNSFFVIITGE